MDNIPPRTTIAPILVLIQILLKTGRVISTRREITYYNEMTGATQWENPMTEHDIADEQSSLDKTSSNPSANRRGSRRRSSFIKSRRRSSVKAALNNVVQKEPGESTAQ